MMSDEEDFDEFPSITVNSSIHESSSFSMPNAEELATQRAREAECESALLRLREEHHRADRECAGGVGLTVSAQALAHSDSSGSEGEAGAAAAAAALAAAVCALRVAAGAPAAPCLLRALRAQRPGDALLAAYQHALDRPQPNRAHSLTDEIAESISEMVLEATSSEDVQVWDLEELLSITAWLCAAVCAPAPSGGGGGSGGRGRGGRRELLRALHSLIEDVATDEQIKAVSSLVESCAGVGSAALQLSDALCGAGGTRGEGEGGTRGEGLARTLSHAALAHLAGLTQTQDVSMGEISRALSGTWRRLPPPQQYLALQLLARLLPPTRPSSPPGGQGRGEGEGEVARSLLEALAQAAPVQRAQTTDQLKVLVAATKLQVLFHVNK